jgi:hypothetical protein
MVLQVHRDRLPPMLDYDVQESIYRDKDGCVVVIFTAGSDIFIISMAANLSCTETAMSDSR